MVFIESAISTLQVRELLTDEEYAERQTAMTQRPDAGALIQGTGGLSKLRWKRAGTGKSGGVRVIYYWLLADHQIRLLMIYPKSRKDDLSTAGKAALRKIVEKWNG